MSDTSPTVVAAKVGARTVLRTAYRVRRIAFALICAEQ